MFVANDDSRGGEAQARTSEHQALLGALINIAGRQRMLSHRAVMFLALSQAPDEREMDALLAEAEQAFAAYETGVKLLVSGDAHQGIPPLFSARVRAILSRPAGSRASGALVLESFGGDGRACLEALRAGEPRCSVRVRRLAELAGGVLLPLLNGVVAALEEDLAEALQQDAERSADLRAVMTGALDDIEQTATKIRLIAFNALIEAARAGDAGRAFSVIAEEIKNLGAQTRTESARMQAAITRLFAA